jgi:aromatic-L-amino-acid/L-tryptophan decarboxylase
MDPQEFREAGHQVVDWIGQYFEQIEEHPLFPDVEPRALDRSFDEPLPQEASSAASVLEEVKTKLLPYCTHVNHPGYMGLITPTPTPMGVIGDLLASALNQNLGAYSIGPSAVAMERRVVRWLTDLCGYGPSAGGNLTSGGMLANFLGLKLARDWASHDRAQHEGLRERWAVYVSEERHVSVDKAVDAVGVGREALRALPTDERFRVRLDALENALESDRKAGVRPMCIVGLAGTTNTGSIDSLADLRRIADRVGAWLHVDAAYGGGLLLSQKRPGRLADLKLADSVTLDPHKWFYAPLDAGAVLVKDARRLTVSFGMKPAYLTDEFDPDGERYQYYVHGFEQSRRFRGLKVWMSFKRYGAREIGRWVDRNIEQAEHMEALARASGLFESATSPEMSAICLRYSAPMDEQRSARLHREVAQRVERSGRFWIGTTVLKGRSHFRINPVNLRTRIEHMDGLFALLREECARVHADLSPQVQASK